jgi:hypothetical protein
MDESTTNPQQLWSVLGYLLAASILYSWLCVVFRCLPTPRMSEAVFIAWFVGGAVVSVVVARRVSRWWYFVTGAFALTYIAIIVGEYLLER